MLSLETLREKIKNLEDEKVRLQEEVNSLRQEADGKVIALECEIAVLREEADSLKKMLKTF
jgi:predicted  nucleic acid-binding Zn-ribbon protein